MSTLETTLADISNAIRDVAIYLSEDQAKMNLSECFSIFSDLLDKIETAKKENEMRKIQEEKAAARLAAELTLKQDGKVKRKIPSKVDEEVCVVDRLFADIRRGDFKLRKADTG